MTYFAIKNLKAKDVRVFTDPSVEAAACKSREPQLTDKAARQKWLTDAKADACLFSTYEGCNSAVRIDASAGNPVWKLHGLVGDYDAPSPGSIAQIKANLEKILGKGSPLLPQWVVTSPGGNYRLVWEFEKPLLLGNMLDYYLASLIDGFKVLLKMPLLMAGLDEGALKRPSQFYDVGGVWDKFNTNPLPKDEVEGVFFKAGTKKATGRALSGVPEIPMDAVFERIEQLFPGKWPKGVPFTDGVVGPAVWDPSAKNPRSTIYRTFGVICFSAEDKAFKPYAEILGPDWVRKWTENKVGIATELIHYIPSSGRYYRKWPDNHWRSQGKDDLSLYLAGSQGLCRAKGPANSPSEVDYAILHVQQNRVLDGAVPLVYDKRDIVTISGHKFLNTSRVKVMEPDLSGAPIAHWGDGFPWIAQWLTTMFQRPRKQLVYWLSWFKIAYVNARAGTPCRGHSMFIVGETNVGKTLMNAKWIPSMMGGSFDAGAHLVGGESFNKNLLEVGYWHIDDGMAATDRVRHQQFTERTKALTANPFILYRAMYSDPIMIPYNGRICITLNGDADSLKMLPDFDRNNEDKVIVLKTSDTRMVWKGNAHTESMLAKETPRFLRFIEEYVPPDFIMNDNCRFKMRNFIHPDVRAEATVHSYDADVLDVFDVLFDTNDDWNGLKSMGKPWVGTAAELVVTINSQPNASKMLNGITVRSMSKRLSKLAKTQLSGVEAVPHGKTKRFAAKYSIHARD